MRVHLVCSYGVVPFSSICAFRKPRPCTPPGRELAFNPGVPARRPTLALHFTAVGQTQVGWGSLCQVCRSRCEHCSGVTGQALTGGAR